MKTFIACKLSDSRLEFLQDGNVTLQVEYEIVTQLCKSKALTHSKSTYKQAGSVSIYKWDAKDFQRYFPIARRIEQMMKTDSSAKRESSRQGNLVSSDLYYLPMISPSFWYQQQGTFFLTWYLLKYWLLRDMYKFFNDLPFTFSRYLRENWNHQGLVTVSRTPVCFPEVAKSVLWQVPGQFISASSGVR